MVTTLLRLKFSLTKNSLKREVWTLIFLIIGSVMSLGIIPLLGAGAFGLSFLDVPVASAVLIIVGSIVILGWILLPLLFFGSDETLDPSRFSTLYVPTKQLTIGLLLSGFIGVPGLITGICVFLPALAWMKHPLAAVVALIVAPIAVLSCFAFSRWLTTLTANSLRSRRGRDAIALLGFLVIIGISQIFSLASGIVSIDSLMDQLQSVGAILAWTPLGAVWAIPGDVALGNYGVALARVAIALGALFGALYLWARSLNKAMISPTEAHGKSTTRADNAIAKLVMRPWAKFGSPATWAIAARCLRYWRTDPRYLVSVASMAILPLIYLLMNFSMSNIEVDGPVDFLNILMATVGPFLAMLMGWGLHNDIGSDSTAFWVHVSTDVSGKADRAGRILAMSLWAVPAIAVVTVGSVFYSGFFDQIPMVLGISAALYLAGCAVASVLSATLTYPIARPGESPMKAKTGTSGVTILVQLGSTFVVLVLAIPAIALGICSIMIGPQFGWLTLVVGVVGGLGVLVVGINKGAAIYEKRSVALLSQLIKADV